MHEVDSTCLQDVVVVELLCLALAIRSVDLLEFQVSVALPNIQLFFLFLCPVDDYPMLILIISYFLQSLSMSFFQYR